MRLRSRPYPKAFALPAVLMFLTVAFAMWAIVFRSASTSLRLEDARAHRDTRATWLAPATAAGLRLLETGMPPSDSYECKLPITQDGQTRYFLLTFEKIGPLRWTVECEATDEDDDAPDAPATFFEVPDAPGDLTADAQSASKINLAWSDVYYDDGYVIEQSMDGTTGWTIVGTTPRNVTSLECDDLLHGTTYYYRVRGTNSAGTGAASEVASAITNG